MQFIVFYYSYSATDWLLNVDFKQHEFPQKEFYKPKNFSIQTESIFYYTLRRGRERERGRMRHQK